MTSQMGVCEHITTNDFDPYGFFSNPANQASSHLWIALDGTVEQYVDLRLCSWAQAGGNPYWTSVEVAGRDGTFKTPAQCEALAQLLAWGAHQPELRWQLRPSDSPATPGIGWHGMGGAGWGGHIYCPGGQRVIQTRQTVLPRAQQLIAPVPTPTPPPEEEPMAAVVTEDKHSLYGIDGAGHAWHIPSPKVLVDVARTKLYGAVDVNGWPTIYEVEPGTLATMKLETR